MVHPPDKVKDSAYSEKTILKSKVNTAISNYIDVMGIMLADLSLYIYNITQYYYNIIPYSNTLLTNKYLYRHIVHILAINIGINESSPFHCIRMIPIILQQFQTGLVWKAVNFY